MNILSDSGLTTISAVLDLKTMNAQSTIENLLTKNSSFPNIKDILKSQEIIEKFRNLDQSKKTNVKSLFNKIVDNEKSCKFFHEKTNTLDSLEKDTFGQLIFQHSDLKIFNTFPFLLFLISYMKIYFVPLVSIVLPVLAYFLPYLLIKYVWKLPMTYDIYQKIMGQMWSFSLSSSPEKILQNLFTIFTFAQSMYQPIQTAFHLFTIDTTIHTLGKALIDYSNSVNELQTLLKNNNINFNIQNGLESLCDTIDYRKNFIYVLEHPETLLYISSDISKLEILYNISQNSDFKKVNIYSSNKPFLKIKNCYDINLSKETRVGSDFNLDISRNHFLLSGPNGGGKSSFLRGLLQTVLFSQSFGYAIGDSIDYSPFDYIFSGLHIQDIPGEKSLFEKEVCFARDVLYYNNPKYKGLVLFDEIFHSTNPPDGIRTSNEFLNKLWKYDHICSIVSTHVFEIIEQSPSYIHKICVKAVRKNDKLIYDYKISEGICKESSVTEIWKKIYSAGD